MAIPLFVECIPGLMMEFLEGLEPKQTEAGGERTKLSFLLQGGFTEACQLRCCEQYLQQLPAFLNCGYGGTLIKGGMFVTHMMPESEQQKMVKPFREMGAVLAADGCFVKEKADAFAGAEYSSGATIALFTMLGPVHKLFFEWFFKKQGCTDKLTAKPYDIH